MWAFCKCLLQLVWAESHHSKLWKYVTASLPQRDIISTDDNAALLSCGGNMQCSAAGGHESRKQNELFNSNHSDPHGVII